jgi:hypothetical protein
MVITALCKDTLGWVDSRKQACHRHWVDSGQAGGGWVLKRL